MLTALAISGVIGLVVVFLVVYAAMRRARRHPSAEGR